MVEIIPVREVSEGCWELVCGLVEPRTVGKMSDSGWEVLCVLVKVGAESEVC